MKTKITISFLITASFLFIASVSHAQWLVTGTNTYTNPLANYVGIGFTTPNFPLDVSTFINAGSISSGNAFQLSLNTQNAAVGIQSTTRHAVFGTTGGNNDILFVNYDFTGTSTYLEHMRITNPGNVGIGTATPDASALLHVSSNSKGVLIPQIQLSSTTDATTITLPATSLLVYNTLGGGLSPAGYYYNAGTSGTPNWVMFGTSNGWALTGNSGTNPPTNFIGTTDAKDWVVKTNNTERMRVLSGGNVGIGTTTPVEKLVATGAIVSTGGFAVGVPSSFGMSYESSGTGLLLCYGSNTSTRGALQMIQRTSNGASSNTPIEVKNDGTLLLAQSLGKVGIGTAFPLYKTVIQTTSGAWGLSVTTNANDTETGFYVMPDHINSIVKLTASGGTNKSMAFYSGSSTEVMRYTTSGNVGIGTTSPAQKLHIASNAATLRLEGTDHTFMEFFPDGPTTRKAWFGFGGASDNNITLLNENSGAHIIFSTTGTGKVGIGTTSPGALLDLQGTAGFNLNGPFTGTGANSYASDQLFKTNVDSLQNALTTISQLKPKSYYFDTTNVYGLNFSKKKQYGFIAQDVETILPELITEITKLADYDTSGNVVHPAVTYKGLNYNAFFGILTKGIQEQSKEIDSLKTKTNNQDSISTALQKAQQQSIDSLRTKMVAQDSTNVLLQNSLNQLMAKTNYQDSINTSLQNQLTQLLNCCNNHGNNGHSNNLMPSGTNNSEQNNKSMVINSSIPQGETTQIDVKLSDIQSLVLEQNVPNPFAEQTTINYSLPDNTVKAQMLFYNSQGKLIQSTELIQKGKGQLNVFANDLSSGIYTYTLVVDNKIIETKKMIKQ